MQTVKVKRGDTLKFTAVFTTNGVQDDLTDATARMHIRDKQDDLMLVVDNSEEIHVLPDGTVNVAIQPTNTSALDPGKYVSDLEVTFQDGTVRSSDTFQIQVLKDITY